MQGGHGLLETDSARLGSVGCDRAGPAFLPRRSTGVGRFVSPRPAGIQLAGYSGASAGQRGASGWVRLCGHGVQRVPGIPASSPTGSHTASSCPDVPSSHKCLTVDAVGLFWLLQTVLYQSGSSRIQAGLQLGCHGEQPLTPLSLGQGYLARKELILSSLMHSNQDLALRNQSQLLSTLGRPGSWVVGVWQEVGCAHASWTWRAEALKAASGNGQGEPGKPGGLPKSGLQLLGGQ